MAWKRQAVCSVKSVVGNWVIIIPLWIIVTPEVEEIKHDKTWMATLSFYMFLFIFGWITGGREAYSRNYRHYVIQCPVSPLAWWVSGDRTTIHRLCLCTCLCNNRIPWSLYHAVRACCKILFRQLQCKSCCKKVCTRHGMNI